MTNIVKHNPEMIVFIKFVLTNGEITVDEEQAKSILKSGNQLIPIKGFDGEWTGETINKAFIVRTARDYDRTRQHRLELQAKEQKKLEEAERQRLLKMSPEEKAKLEEEEKIQREKVAQMFSDLRKKFKISGTNDE